MSRSGVVIGLLVSLCAAWSPVTAAVVELPQPDLEGLEPTVAEQLTEMRALASTVVHNSLVGPADKAKAWAEMGQIYHAYALLDAAEICYEQAEAAAPDDPAWPYYRGHVALESGDLERAAEHFTRALELEAGNQATLVFLADTVGGLGRREEARALLERAASLPAPEPVVHARLGELALAEERFEEAVERLTHALDEVPQATRLHHPLGLAYRGLGDMGRARHHLEQRGQVGLAPRDPRMDRLESLKVGERVHLLRGRSAYQAGSYAEAAEQFRLAVEAQPESVRARINLSAALAAMNDVSGALKELELAVALEPENPTARFNLGALLASAGRHEEAIGHLAAATRIRPDDEEAWMAEIRSWVALGDFPRATARSSVANSALPESGRIAFALARLLAASPDPSVRDGVRALDLAVRVFEAQRTAEHAILVTEALGELGRCVEAREWLATLIEEARASDAGTELPLLEARAAELAGTESCRP